MKLTNGQKGLLILIGISLVIYVVILLLGCWMGDYYNP